MALGFWRNTWAIFKGSVGSFLGVRNVKCMSMHLTLWLTFLMSLWAWHEYGPRSSKFSSSLSSAGKSNKSNTAETPWFFFNIDLTAWQTVIWICMGNKGCPNCIGQHFYLMQKFTRYTHTIHVHSDAAMSDSGSDILSMPWPFGTMVNMHSSCFFGTTTMPALTACWAAKFFSSCLLAASQKRGV